MIKELLSELSRLKLLITSRALLWLYGEYEYVVPPLALPTPAVLQTQSGAGLVEQLAAYEAVELFIQRAR